MGVSQPLWITEADVVELMDLTDAIEALEAGLRLQAEGRAASMGKTHLAWGDGDTLHAIGAVLEGDGLVGTKTWAHTPKGATPLVVVWDAHTGVLRAIIEAFALGQMRTGGVSGVATRWMSRPDSKVFALIGTGKQALAQLAAVAAVRSLEQVRVWGRDPAKLAAMIQSARGLGYGYEVSAADTVAAAADGADIVTLVTRAREPFFRSGMAAPGTHINAVGAITPEREEFAQDLFARTGLMAADDPAAVRRLSAEFMHQLGDSGWERVLPLSRLAAAAQPRPGSCDLSIFKAMGMGLSDLALASRVLERAIAAGLGKAIDPPKKSAPRLSARRSVLESLP